MEQEFTDALLKSIRWYEKNDSDLWHTTFVHTKEYQRIDSLLNDGWDDLDTPIEDQ